MSLHRPSRWLAPLALLASVVAVLMVYSSSTGDGESDSGTRTEERARGGSTDEERDEAETTGRTSTTSKRKRYTVKSGDTLALISERTGISVEELLELNPDIDPNSLTVGEKIKLNE